MKKITSVMIMLPILTTSLAEFSSCAKSYSGRGEVQLVTDGGNINDLSFVQQSWEAVKDFATSNKKTYSYKIPSQLNSEHEFINCYKAAVASDAKVIVAIGYLQQSALTKYASDIKKDIKFVTVDFKINENGYKRNNVAQICYKAEQSGFYAGIAACCYLNANAKLYLKNDELKVATFGGMDIDAVTSYMFGFHCATVWWNNDLENTGINYAEKLDYVKKINSDITKLHPIKNISASLKNNPFSGTFKITDGLIITEKLLNLGANIIFPVAGLQTQDVITKINSSQEYKNVKVIGVDTDQAKLYSNDQAKFLTSALKKIKHSVVNTLEKWHNNNNDLTVFTKQEIYGDYNNQLIGISKSKYLPDNLIQKITELKQPTQRVTEIWNEICRDNSSSSLWEKAMKKNIIL